MSPERFARPAPILEPRRGRARCSKHRRVAQFAAAGALLGACCGVGVTLPARSITRLTKGLLFLPNVWKMHGASSTLLLYSSSASNTLGNTLYTWLHQPLGNRQLPSCAGSTWRAPACEHAGSSWPQCKSPKRDPIVIHIYSAPSPCC